MSIRMATLALLALPTSAVAVDSPADREDRCRPLLL